AGIRSFHVTGVQTCALPIFDPRQLASTLLESLLRQIVIDGTFHADPHPGNVMLTTNDRLTLLDFGSVGRMDSMLRTALLRLIMRSEERRVGKQCRCQGRMYY